MGCKKDKAEKERRAGMYECTKCGAVAKKKDKVCKGRKINDSAP